LFSYIKRLGIRFQLYFVTMMIVISMVAIILMSYYQLSHAIEVKNREYYNQLISQINQTIMSNTDSINRLVKNIAYNKTIVQEYLGEKDPSKQFQLYKKLQDYLSDMRNLKDGIIDIAIIGKDGNATNLNGSIDQLMPIAQEIPENVLHYYSGLKHLSYVGNGIDYRNVIIAGARIYSISDFSPENRELGYIMIALEPNAIMNSQKAVLDLVDSNLYMLDRDGAIFFTNDAAYQVGSKYKSDSHNQTQGGETFQDEDYIIQTGDIPDLEGEITYKIYKADLLKGIDSIRRQQLFIFFISVLFFLIPYSFVVNNILSPLKKLMQFMNEIKSGKLKTLKKRVEVEGYAEIIVMSEEFNSMLDEINELTHRLFDTTSNLYETELAKRRTEMAYLKSQINPHFLYNTLESIKGIAVEEGVDRIFNMSNALAQIFRYCIKGSDFVTLEDEMKIIKQYLYIQKNRFGNRLEIAFELTEDAMKGIVPKMLIQPIIENSVFHGLEPKVGVGHLLIGAELQEENLIISICDDGVGIDPSTLQQIHLILNSKQELLFKDQEHPDNGIGIVNVNNQIRLIYGKSYGLVMVSEVGKGTQTFIKMPYRSEEHV
jgi:two-component system sensor histidine kinase YesM